MRTYSLKNLVWIAVLSKICIFLVMISAFYLFPFNYFSHDANFVYPAGEAVTPVTVLKTWDGQHYIYLAEKGYSPNLLSNVIYPLYPMLLHFFRVFFFNNTLLAGLALSHLFLFVALIYFYLFVKKLFDEKTAFISGLFFLAFPTMFYSSLVYTESMFLMLSILFMYYLYQRDLFPALITSFLLPLARAQGILIVCPLVVFIFLQNFEKGKFKFRFTREWFLPLGFAAGFASYLCFMNYFTGSYFTGFETQKYYLAHFSVLNLLNPAAWFMNNFVNITLSVHSFTTSFMDRAFFILFLILLLPAYQKLDKTLFFYLLALGLIPAMLGNMMAYSRYILEAFPMFITMALVFRERHYFATVPMIVLQTILLLRQALNYWVG